MPRKLSSYRLLTDAEEAGNTREYGEYGDTCTFPLLVVGGSTVTEYGEYGDTCTFPLWGVR
jgi:hypothetical protein